jgi:hypothetical protein
MLPKVRRKQNRVACQIQVNDLTCDVLDVEATLAFAEHELMNLPRLWREYAPTDRQGLVSRPRAV